MQSNSPPFNFYDKNCEMPSPIPFSNNSFHGHIPSSMNMPWRRETVPYADRGYYPPPPYPMYGGYGYHPMYYGMPTPMRDPGYFPYPSHNPYEGMPSICNQQINKFNVVNCQIDQSPGRRSQEPYFQNSNTNNTNIPDPPIQNSSTTINREESHTTIHENISIQNHSFVPQSQSDQYKKSTELLPIEESPPPTNSQPLIQKLSVKTPSKHILKGKVRKSIECEAPSNQIQDTNGDLPDPVVDHHDDGASIHTSNTSRTAYTTQSSRLSIGSNRSRSSKRFQQSDSLLSLTLFSSSKPPPPQRPTTADSNTSIKATTSPSVSKEKPTDSPAAVVNDLPVSLIKKRVPINKITPPTTSSASEGSQKNNPFAVTNPTGLEAPSDSKKRKSFPVHGSAKSDQSSKASKIKPSKEISTKESTNGSQSDEEQEEAEGDHSDDISEEDSLSSKEIIKKPTKKATKVKSNNSKPAAAPKIKKVSTTKAIKEKAVKPSKVSKAAQGKLSKVQQQLWTPQEVVALYSIQQSLVGSESAGWAEISSRMSQRGFHKSPAQCEERWTLALLEAQKRREKKQQDALKLNTSAHSSNASPPSSASSKTVGESTSVQSSSGGLSLIERLRKKNIHNNPITTTSSSSSSTSSNPSSISTSSNLMKRPENHTNPSSSSSAIKQAPMDKMEYRKMIYSEMLNKHNAAKSAIKPNEAVFRK